MKIEKRRGPWAVADEANINIYLICGYKMNTNIIFTI